MFSSAACCLQCYSFNCKLVLAEINYQFNCGLLCESKGGSLHICLHQWYLRPIQFH